jgi:hypothetical protein
MRYAELIGWMGSAILLATITRQVSLSGKRSPRRVALALHRTSGRIHRFYGLQLIAAQQGLPGLEYRPADNGGHRANYLSA